MDQIKVFTSQSCVPCARYKKELEGLPNITYVDVDDPANLMEAIAANVMQVPTTVFSTGEVWTGVHSRADVLGASQEVFQVEKEVFQVETVGGSPIFTPFSDEI